MNDVWVDRIKAIFAGLKDLLIAAAAIIAAWQSVNNNSEIKVLQTIQQHHNKVMDFKEK